jgi:WD40 repeat protein
VIAEAFCLVTFTKRNNRVRHASKSSTASRKRSPMRSLFIVGLLVSLTATVPAQSTDNALLAKLDCPDRVKDVAFSPDGKLLAAGFGWNEGGARIWNMSDQKVVATLAERKGEGANVESVAFSPDGKLFAAANWDGDVLLWNVGAWNSHKTILAKRGMPKCLRFSPDSTKLAFASEEAAIIYDFRSGTATTLTARMNERDSLISMAFSPSSNSVFVFRDESVQTWDVESRKLIRTWKPSGFGFFGNVSPDGNYVIAGGGAVYGKKSVEIWKASDQKKIGEVSEFRSGLFGMAISHSEKLFAVSGGNYGSGGDLSLWTLNEPHEIGFISFGEFPLEGLAFSPDDKVLAAGSDDGFVLLYAVDRIHGPQVKKQDYSLCGEIVNEDNKTFIVPLSKVPGPNIRNFAYAWKLEIVNSESVTGLAGLPVMLSDWNIESSSDDDRARINQFRPLMPKQRSNGRLNHIVYGDIQNPGWNEGFIAKVYEDGSFVVTNNPGRCLAYGRLEQFNVNFESISKRLVNEGLLAVPKEPLILGVAHFRTRFMEVTVKGAPELRSDADSIEVLLKGAPAKKREIFSRIFDQEESFINSLLHSGIRLPAN